MEAFRRTSRDAVPAPSRPLGRCAVDKAVRREKKNKILRSTVPCFFWKGAQGKQASIASSQRCCANPEPVTIASPNPTRDPNYCGPTRHRERKGKDARVPPPKLKRDTYAAPVTQIFKAKNNLNNLHFIRFLVIVKVCLCLWISTPLPPHSSRVKRRGKKSHKTQSLDTISHRITRRQPWRSLLIPPPPPAPPPRATPAPRPPPRPDQI